MVGELVRAGVVTGVVGSAVLVLRALMQLVVVVWSLRADEAGRRHALRVLDALRVHPSRPRR